MNDLSVLFSDIREYQPDFTFDKLGIFSIVTYNSYGADAA